MATLNEYRNREHWSYSALNQFLNICGLQYALQRIYKVRRAFTPVTLSFGSAFHRTLEWVNLLRKEGQRPVKAEAMDLFQTVWERQLAEDGDVRYDEDGDAESCAKQGRDMVGCVVDGLDPEEEVVAVNEAFAVPLVDGAGDVLEKPIIGEIDTVVRKAGRKALTDWKTAARRWPKGKADLDLQPTVMLYGYRQIHGEVPEFRFDVVVKNKTPVFEQHLTERTHDQFLRMVELVKLAESMIAAEHFVPNEQGFYCAGCQYVDACKAWHREHARCIRFRLVA